MLSAYGIVLVFYAGFFYVNFPHYFHESLPYHSNFVLLEGLNKLGFTTWTLLALLPLVWYRSRLTWDKLNLGSAKWYLLGNVVLLGWFSAFYEYNYFFASGHWWDRVLVVGFSLLSFLHPVFVAPLLITSLVIFSQLLAMSTSNFTIGSFMFLDVMPIYQMLFLGVSFLYLRTVTNLRVSALWLGWILVVASNYFYTGLAKAHAGTHLLDWALNYRPDYFFGWARYRDWVDFWPQFLQDQMLVFLRTFRQPINFATFLGELAMIFVLLNQWVTFTLLIFSTLLHLAIFTFSGMLFWKWIVVNVLLILTLYGADTELYAPDSHRAVFVCSILFVLGLSMFHGQYLAWWETPYMHRYDVEVQTTTEQRYTLPPSSFGPYARYFHFQESRHNYVLDEKILRTFTNDRNLALSINERLTGTAKLNRVKKELGTNYYHPEKANEFRNFLEQFITNHTKYKTRLHRWLGYISPPAHIPGYTSDRYTPLTKIEGRPAKISLVFREAYFDGEEFHPATEKTILDIPLNDTRSD